MKYNREEIQLKDLEENVKKTSSQMTPTLGAIRRTQTSVEGEVPFQVRRSRRLQNSTTELIPEGTPSGLMVESQLDLRDFTLHRNGNTQNRRGLFRQNNRIKDISTNKTTKQLPQERVQSLLKNQTKMESGYQNSDNEDEEPSTSTNRELLIRRRNQRPLQPIEEKFLVSKEEESINPLATTRLREKEKRFSLDNLSDSFSIDISSTEKEELNRLKTETNRLNEEIYKDTIALKIANIAFKNPGDDVGGIMGTLLSTLNMFQIPPWIRMPGPDGKKYTARKLLKDSHYKTLTIPQLEGMLKHITKVKQRIDNFSATYNFAFTIYSLVMGILAVASSFSGIGPIATVVLMIVPKAIAIIISLVTIIPSILRGDYKKTKKINEVIQQKKKQIQMNQSKIESLQTQLTKGIRIGEIRKEAEAKKTDEIQKSVTPHTSTVSSNRAQQPKQNPKNSPSGETKSTPIVQNIKGRQLQQGISQEQPKNVNVVETKIRNRSRTGQQDTSMNIRDIKEIRPSSAQNGDESTRQNRVKKYFPKRTGSTTRGGKTM